MNKKCGWHLCNNTAKRRWCSQSCKNKFYVSQNRRNMKLKAIEYMGGKCEMCGYDKCVSAMEFHHKDPTQKDFNVSKNGHTRSWEKIQSELDKCILLCANCHREKHEQLLNTPN